MVQVNNFTGFESGSVNESASSSGAAVFSSNPRSGIFMLAMSNSGGNQRYDLSWVEDTTDAGGKHIFGFAFYFEDAAPTVDSVILEVKDDSGGVILDVQFLADDTLRLRDAVGGTLDTTAAALSIDTYYYFEIYFDGNSASGDWEWFRDGVSEGSGSGADFTDGNAFGSASSVIKMQHNNATDGNSYNWDDVYILSGATASSDRLGVGVSALSFNAGNNTSAVPDFDRDGSDTGGETLDAELWNETARTRFGVGGNPAQYTANSTAQYGVVAFTRTPFDNQGAGPENGLTRLQTTLACKYHWSLREVGGGSQSIIKAIYGKATASSGAATVSEITPALTTSFTQHFKLILSASDRFPNNAEYAVMGFGKDNGGTDDLDCEGMIAHFLVVNSNRQLNNFTGFETQGFEDLQQTSGTPTFETTNHRSGEASLSLVGSQSVNFPFISGNVTDGGANYIVGFAIRISANPTTNFTLCRVRDSGTTTIWSLVFDNTADELVIRDETTTDRDSVAYPFTDDVWHYIEVYFEHNASGLLSVYLDGSLILTHATSDTFNSNSLNDLISAGPIFQGVAGATVLIDDVYILSGCDGPDDRLGGFEVFGHQILLASATPDFDEGMVTGAGTDLDSGDTWSEAGDTPITGAFIGMTTTPGGGMVLADVANANGLDAGPLNDANGYYDGSANIVSTKGIFVAARGNGGGTTHTIHMGASVAAGTTGRVLVSDATIVLTASADDFEMLTPNVPLVTEDVALGIEIVGAREWELFEMWAMIAHVPDVVGGVTTKTIDADLDALLTKQDLLRAADLDALLTKQDLTVASSLDAILTLTRTLNTDLDALLFKAGLTVASNLGALLFKSGLTVATDLDAQLVKQGLTVATDIDALLTKTGLTVSANLDALLKAIGVEVSTNLDALLTEIDLTKTVNLDALLARTNTRQALLDALLFGQDITVSTDLEALLFKAGVTKQTNLDSLLTTTGLTRAVDLDAFIQVQLLLITNLDALLTKTNLEVTASLEALLKGLGVTQFANLDALLFKSGLSVSTSLDALLFKSGLTVASSLDALLTEIGITASADLDAIITAVGFTETANLNAILFKAGITSASSLDAILAGFGITVSADLDAQLVELGLTVNVSLDAFLTEVGLTKTASLDAFITAAGLIVSADLDAILKALGVTKAVSLDALLIGIGITASAELDALLFKSDLTVAASLDAIIVGTAAKTVSAVLDALLTAIGETRTANLDALLTKPGLTVSVSLDALLAIQILLSTDLDALLTEIGVEATASLDALLKGLGVTKTADLDALLFKSGLSVSTSLNGVLKALGLTRTASLNGLLTAIGVTAVADLDALLTETGLTISASLDAILAATVSRTISAVLDALLTKTGETVLADLDALLTVQDLTVTTSVDALLLKLVTVQTTLDALVAKQDIPLTVDLGALIRDTLELTVSLDAVLSTRNIVSADLDGLISALDQTRLAQLDALLQGIASIASSLDALLTREGIEVFTNLDALVVGSQTVAAQLDALLRGTAIVALQVDALLTAKNIIVSSQLDALLVLAGLRANVNLLGTVVLTSSLLGSRIVTTSLLGRRVIATNLKGSIDT